MKRIALLVAVSALLGACGGTDDGVKLAAGTYKIAVTPVVDSCNVFTGMDSDTFRLEVAADEKAITAYFARANGTADATKMTGTMENSALSATLTVPWVDDAMTPTCHTEFTKAISGTVTSEEAAEFTYTWDEKIIATQGDTCTSNSLAWTTASPCHSEVKVTLTQKLP